MPSTTLAAAEAARRRWRPGLLLVALVVAAHAWLLRTVALGAGDDSARPGVKVLQVRRIERPAVAAAPVPPALPAPAPRLRPLPPLPARAPSPVAPPPAQAPTPEPSPMAAASEPAAAEAGPATTVAGPAGPAEPAEAAASAAALLPPAGGGELPVYATRLPPPATLIYTLQRGALQGSGSLSWRHDGQHYEISLEGTVFGLSILEQTSVGGFDAAGLAPLRFADRRRGRELRAANFRRDVGRISFSGPSVEYPLVPGAQDRLSWIVQLAAIAAAAPADWRTGSRVAMFVAGSRGEGDAWVFTLVDTEAGLHFVREPRREYDTRIEVWLDPARGFWPSRLRQTVLPGDEWVELQLDRGP